jgi:hypothetical protein
MSAPTGHPDLARCRWCGGEAGEHTETVRFTNQMKLPTP